jgi:YD repeat-containing protein
MIEARDSFGNAAKYTYDAENRLVSVDYAAGSVIKYWYDSANRVVRIEDSSSATTLENKYSRTGSVEQTTIDGETYGIRHLVDEVQITGPQGDVTRVHITESGRNTSYTVEKLVHGSVRQ